jgi:hypothetical protein
MNDTTAAYRPRVDERLKSDRGRYTPRVTARSRLPRRALVARIVIVVLVVWLAVTGVLIVLARQRASRGLDALQQAKS